MASVLFFRSVNVGKHQRFQPRILAKALVSYGVLNVGAAGTFVVREPVKQSDLKEEIFRRLSFRPEMMMCSVPELIALDPEAGFGKGPERDDERRFVTILQKTPHKRPILPFEQPAGKDWQVRVLGSQGKFVMSLQRKQERISAYPNAVVEKIFGVPATTRSWTTIAAVMKVLEADLMAELS